jgi:hypothetical protein
MDLETIVRRLQAEAVVEINDQIFNDLQGIAQVEICFRRNRRQEIYEKL